MLPRAYFRIIAKTAMAGFRENGGGSSQASTRCACRDPRQEIYSPASSPADFAELRLGDETLRSAETREKGSPGVKGFRGKKSKSAQRRLGCCAQRNVTAGTRISAYKASPSFSLV